MIGFEIGLKEFEKRYKEEKEGRAKIRLQILLLRKKKYTQQDIAATTSVTQGTVSNICTRFQNEGWNSVYDKPRSGKPPLLTQKQKEHLYQAMKQEIKKGKTRRGWQTKDVRIFIKEKFNQAYTPQHTRRIMHQLGMSPKVPRPQHQNQNQTDLGRFKKNSRGRSSLWQMNTESSA